VPSILVTATGRREGEAASPLADLCVWKGSSSRGDGPRPYRRRIPDGMIAMAFVIPRGLVQMTE